MKTTQSTTDVIIHIPDDLREQMSNINDLSEYMVDILRKSFRKKKKAIPLPQVKFSDMGVCGMWEDRIDMGDVDAYIRNLRKPRHHAC